MSFILGKNQICLRSKDQLTVWKMLLKKVELNSTGIFMTATTIQILILRGVLLLGKHIMYTVLEHSGNVPAVHILQM